MILLLWIALVVLPVLAGTGVMSLLYGKKNPQEILFSDSYLLGLLAFIGMGEMAHLSGFFMNWTLTHTGLMFALLVALMMLFSLMITWYMFFYRKVRFFSRLSGEAFPWGIPVAFLLLLGGQLLFLYCRNPLVVSGDIIPETVQSFLAEDGIYRVLPLTGAVSEQGMPLRYTILGLPTIYAMIAKAFGIEAELLVCHVIPVVILSASYLAYYRLSRTLFGEKKQKERFLFLLLVTMLFLFSDSFLFMDGYSALHGAYTGVGIRNLVLVPYTLCAALEGRWWKACLCILAEACIAWTLLGCGVCVVITLGILFLDIAAKHWSPVRKYVQFFRDKEELS